ncbi:MAG: hypothetical protein QM767_29740 [Anaeromyxobacter sp.]
MVVKIRTYEGWGCLALAIILLATFTAQLSSPPRYVTAPQVMTVLPAVSVPAAR